MVLERRAEKMVVVEDQAQSAEDDDVVGVALSEGFDHARKEREVGARERRQANTVDILVDGGLFPGTL